MKDMKWGIIISIAVVAVLVLVYFATVQHPDEPTKRTAPAKLVKLPMPDAAAAPAWNVDDPDNSFGEALQAYVTLATNNVKLLERTPPSAEVSEALVRKLIDAKNAGKIDSIAWLDAKVPMKPNAEPENNPMARAMSAVVSRAEVARKNKDDVKVKRIGESLMAVGSRLWQHSTRYYNRFLGLQMFQEGLMLVLSTADGDTELQAKLKPWDTWRKSANEMKFIKVDRIIRSTTAVIQEDAGGVKFKRIGDLINLAKNDQDATIRVEATLGLALAKFNPGTKANQTAINETIKALQIDPDPQVAAAAAAAEAYTIDEYHRLR